MNTPEIQQVWSKCTRSGKQINRLVLKIDYEHKIKTVTWCTKPRSGSRYGKPRTCGLEAWMNWIKDAKLVEENADLPPPPPIVSTHYTRFEILMHNCHKNGDQHGETRVMQTCNSKEVCHDALARKFEVKTLDDAQAYGLALEYAWNQTLRSGDMHRKYDGVRGYE